MQPAQFDLARYTVQGEARHAGSTPMLNRRDALRTAASAIDASFSLMETSQLQKTGTMTFGNLVVRPGATNVVPGQVIVDSEVRGSSAAAIEKLRTLVDSSFQEAAEKARTKVTKTPRFYDAPAPLSVDLRRRLAEIAQETGLTVGSLPSGGCHDAQVFASRVPAGMIFVESKGGISHNPREFSTPESLEEGSRLLLDLVHELLSNPAR